MAFVSLAQLALAALALLITYRVYWELTTGRAQRDIKKRKGCLPPRSAPTKDPIFGLDVMLKNFLAFNRNDILPTWSAIFTDSKANTVRLMLLRQEVFLTIDPENIKSILALDFSSWSIGAQRIKDMGSYLGTGVLTTDGAAWKHSRDMLRPCFERSQISDVDLFEKHTARFIEAIPKDGSTVDLQPMFHQLTLDISTELLLGKSTDSLKPDCERDCMEFIQAFEYCANPFIGAKDKGFWSTLKVIAMIWLPNPHFNRSVKIMNAFVDKIIVEKIKERETAEEKNSTIDTSASRYVFLDELLSQTSDRTRIRSELMNVLLAGRDTTASLLSNIFFELPRHPHMLARLRAEIAEYCGDELPTYLQLKDMKYLRAFINESQRLWPIVPTDSREALKDTTLPRGGGPDGNQPVFIPKGGFVAYMMYAMHRRTDIYGPDAEEFKPERWLEGEHESSPLRPGWGYLPFNGGPRICIGQQFALTEAAFVIVRLLQAFPSLESRDSEPWKEKLSVTCTGLGGCKVAVRTEVQ